MRQPHELEDTCCHSTRSTTRIVESGIQVLVVSLIGCVLCPTSIALSLNSHSFGCYVSFLEVGGTSQNLTHPFYNPIFFRQLAG